MMLSPRGRNIGVFCIFLFVAAVLWMAKSANDVVQREIRTHLKIVNVPDSMVCLSRIPEYVSVHVSGSGTSMIGLTFGRKTLNVDWGMYSRDGELHMTANEIRDNIRRLFGSGISVLGVNPDTLSLVYTSQTPARLPVSVDARITTLPNCTLLGPATPEVDSVRVYSRRPIPENLRTVTTAPIRLTDIDRTTVVRVPLVVPEGCRAIPDSVDVRVAVEPMISRSVNVPIKAVNVPSGIRLILLPNTVTVNYTVPMSQYSDNNVSVRVIADYLSLPKGLDGNRIAVTVSEARGNFLNMYTTVDSVEYIIERE